MSSSIARKSGGSHWRLILAVGSSIVVLVIVLWRFQLDYQARQRAKASEREARLVALRTEAEARRTRVEQQAAKVKSVDRVGQLYREINKLSQLGERVETSLQLPPRELQSSRPKPQATP